MLFALLAATELFASGMHLDHNWEFTACLANPETCRNLFLDFTVISGTVPTEIGTLVNIRNLEFDTNELTGRLPTEIGRCTSLTWIDLSENKFTGPLPSEIGRIKGLTRLDVRTNTFTGAVPSKVLALKGLKEELFLEASGLSAPALRADASSATSSARSYGAVTAVGAAVGGALLVLAAAGAVVWRQRERASHDPALL